MNVDALDKKLIRRCLENDDEAWRQLYECTFPLAVYKAKQCGVGQTLAEDIAQETMVELTKKLPKIKKIKSWVSRVARNRCIDHIRNKNAAAPKETSAVLDRLGSCDNSTDGADDPKVLKELYDYVQSLQSPCRDLIQNRFFHEMSYVAMADNLSFSVNQVGVYLARCLSRLKKHLKATNNDLFQELELYMQTTVN